MTETPKVSTANNRGLQDDHDPSDIGQRIANKPGQGIVRDERGQEQPADKKRAQQTDGGSADDRSPHQDAQHGADVPGQPSMVQKQEALPEGLRRERKGPYDKNVGRAKD